MVGSGMLDGLFTTLIGLGLVIGGLVWGCWELVDWLWIDDAIRVSKPLVPEIEITVKNNVIDTLYIYREPK